MVRTIRNKLADKHPVPTVAGSCAIITLALGVGGLTHADDLPYDGHGHVMVDGSDLDWGPVGSMPPGAEITVLEGDLASEEPFTFRLRFPADYAFAPHVHPAYERVTVLKGQLHFGHGTTFNRANTHALPVGGFAVMAPGEPMFGYTEEETIIQLHGIGPWGIEYVDPEDDPRN